MASSTQRDLAPILHEVEQGVRTMASLAHAAEFAFGKSFEVSEPTMPGRSSPSGSSRHLEQSGFEVDEDGQALRRKPPRRPHSTPGGPPRSGASRHSGSCARIGQRELWARTHQVDGAVR